MLYAERMGSSFAKGFVSELQSCLAKVAAPGEAPGAGAPRRPSGSAPSGLAKNAGVASGLERLYLTLAPSAAAKDALRYATPRMDAHLVGRDAAKLLARKARGFGELVGRGRRSASQARQVLDKRAEAAPFTLTMRVLAERIWPGR